MCKKIEGFLLNIELGQTSMRQLMSSVLLSTVHDYYIDTISESNLLYLLLFLFWYQKSIEGREFHFAL